jgi:hypothetical protein
MPLPNAKPDPAGSNVYRQLNSITLGNLTNAQFEVVYDNLFLNDMSEDELRRLALIGAARQSFSASSSGPIPGTLKLLSFRYTTTGNNFEDLGIEEGEVWQLNTLSIAEGGSGTATVSFALYDPITTDQSVIAVQSTTTQQPVAVASEGVGSPIYITSDLQLNNLVNNTGGTHVDVDLTIIRVR